MPRGAKGRRGQGWPIGASAAWSQTCGFWGNDVVPKKIFIDCYDPLFPDPIPSFNYDSIGVTSTLWTGTANAWCGYTDTYGLVTLYGNIGVYVDIFKALALGLWTSSVAINVYSDGPGTLLYARSENGTPYVTKSVSATSILNCPTTLKGTVTVYDDGTLSIA